MNWTRTTTAGRTAYTASDAGVVFSIYRAGTASWRLEVDGDFQGRFRTLTDAKIEASTVLNRILDEKLAASTADRRAAAIAQAEAEDAAVRAAAAVGTMPSLEDLRGILSIHRGDVVALASVRGAWNVTSLSADGTFVAQFNDGDHTLTNRFPGSEVVQILKCAGDDVPLVDPTEETVAAEPEEVLDEASDAIPEFVGDTVPELVEYDPADGETREWAESRVEATRDELANYRAVKAAEAAAPPLHTVEELSAAARDARGWARLSAAIEAGRRGPAAHSVAILAPGDRLVDRGLNVWDVVEIGTTEDGEGFVSTVHIADGYSRRFLFPVLVDAIEAGEIRAYHSLETPTEDLTEERALELVNDALEYHAREWGYALTTRLAEETAIAPAALEIRFPGGAYSLSASILR